VSIQSSALETRTGPVPVAAERKLRVVAHPTTGAASAAFDSESREWLDALRATGLERDRAVQRLHELLLRAAHFEVHRRAASWPAADREDLAQQSADDALMAILAKLDDYRGASRFTTWAYKFALFEAGVKTRRRAWHGRQVVLDSEDWRLIADASVPEHDIDMSELIGAVQRAIEEELTPHQREILIAITMNDVPIDVLAEYLNTTRGALYKTLHDARRKLRGRLVSSGFGEHLLEGGGL
jgi:RNA polymerase sigma-70 factor, ECF subfamily